MTNPKHPNPDGLIWFICKGCGKPAGYFSKPFPPYYPIGAIAHSKPDNLVRNAAMIDAGVSQVQCTMYHQLSCEQYWAINKDAQRIEPPAQFIPYVD